MLTIAIGLIMLVAAIATVMGFTSPNYIPPRAADRIAWAQNFAALITASPGTYGLTAGDATTIQTTVDAYVAAYNLGGGTYHAPVNPATKTVVTTQAAADANTAFQAIVRPYAQQIAISPGVSSDDKIALGLNARTNTPTPIPTPVSFPLLGLRGLTPLGVTLQWQDSALGTGKAKPAGSLQCELHAEASATAITDPSAIAFIGLYTKSPFGLSFDAGDAGKNLYIAARWVTRTGKAGPWSTILVTTIPRA